MTNETMDGVEGFECKGLCLFNTKASTVRLASIALRSVASRLGRAHAEHANILEMVEILYNLTVLSREELAMQKGSEILEGGK